LASLTSKTWPLLGLVSGTLVVGINFPILGFWDEDGQKIVFQVFSPSGQGATQVYTGFMFTDQLRLAGIIGGTVFTLAGYFQVLPSGAIPPSFIQATANKYEFAWYAQIGVT
jgi:hypothetical protein